MKMRSLIACTALAAFLGCGGGEPPAETPSEEAAPAEETAAPAESTDQAAPGVSPEDQEAILQTGLLGEWQWVGFQGMDDSTLEVDDPSKYTLFFRVDGVRVQADCNNGQGSYDLDAPNITFTPFATTMMACPGESLGDRYLGLLAGVRSYVIEDGHLFLSLMMDGGIMEFRPGGGPA